MAKELIHGLDLLEVGCHGFVELISRKTMPDHILPLKTVPVGLPPILPGALDHLEGFLSDLESLAIHDFRNAQKYLPREPRPDRLYYTDVCPVQTTIVVERNPSTGELQSYKEEYLPERCKTSKNSLSLSRAPGPSYADVRGSAGNFPFWPGGLDEPILENLEGDNSIQTVNFDTDFLTMAPGMKDGIIFQKATPVIESVDPSVPNNNVINIADILMQSDDIDIGDSDEEDSSKTSEQQVSGSKEPEASQLGRSESLENLVQIQEKETPTVPDKIEDIKVEQWAFKVDINSPVDDFYKRIPDMAHRWDFELDIFQKQAILHLEKRESVFVAAHTSAGKTVVAEYAIALSLKNMTRTVYTSPIKALSNQKFRDFKNTFNSVGLITGDVQINTTASCLIMTTEILRSMLYNGSDVIRDLEWVIFDEVHYINDSERGVVWEEVLIMLPDHVNIILLSATVPNTMEFADWIGRTKRKKIYVISTLKRPVPLEHYLYTGNSNKTSNELFLILDAKGSFLTTGYTKAVAAKKERASKSSENFGAKGPRGGNPSQDKNIWLSVIEMLKKKEKLPMVAFIFSKRRIEENMINLQSVDLTTAAEKSDIHIFFHKCISRLKKEDRKLPQVVTMENTLKRGLGVHHSGILPILKEVVEMLFQRGLVKILFATETFAMGVNMPARTVMFDSIRKHDGTAMRNLLPGEYVQMAGRAGRRGLDSTGTVIILCKGDVPETAELHKMMLGRPTQLESQFRLTYTMILNLFGVDQLRVEDMMRRSFSEFRTQRDVKQHEHTLEQLKAQLKNVKDIECYLCSIDLEKYYQTCREYQKLKKHLQKIVISHPAAIKALSPGRVVIVDNGIHSNVLGVVLQTGLGSGNSRIFSVLIICNRDSNSEGRKTTNVNDQKLTPVLNKQLFIPDTICWHSLLELEPSSISVITSKTIKIDADKILKDVKKREQPRFKDDPPSQSVTMATQELLRLSEENPHGLSGLDPVKDLKLHDIDLVEQFRSLQFIKEEFPQFQCVHCPKLDEHFQQMNANMRLKDEYRHLQFLLSDQSLQLLPEYQQRKELLQRLHYIDGNSAVQLKGRVACQISTQEIMITELIFDNVLTELDSTDIAALLSSMVFEQKKCSEPNLTDTLQKGCEKILAKAEYIGHLQRDVGLKIPVDDYKMEFHFGLMEVVFEWARGMPFADIIVLTDVQEGIIVRCIQRLYDLLHDIRNTARTIGDPTLFKKMDEAMTKIKRDIVFAASLYTQ